MVAQWCWVFFQLGSTRKERKIVSLTVKSSFQVQCKCPTLPANCPIPPTHHPQTSPFFSVNSALFCYICTVTRCVTCSLNLKNFSFLFFFSFFFFFFPFLLTWEMDLVFKLDSATPFVILRNSHLSFNSVWSIEKKHQFVEHLILKLEVILFNYKSLKLTEIWTWWASRWQTWHWQNFRSLIYFR